MIYLLSIIFTLLFIVYSKYQFEEVQGTSQGKWHTHGMLMRISAIVTPFIMQYIPATWQDYLLAGAINIILWEFGINKIALKQKLLYIGSSSMLDIQLGKRKWWIYFGFFGICLLIRLFT